MPLMPLPQAAERAKLLEYRASMREGSGMLTNAEQVQEACDFERAEKARYAAASEMIRRGVADGEIITRAGLFDADELYDIKAQLGLCPAIDRGPQGI
jgi:hypothetical protein